MDSHFGIIGLHINFLLILEKLNLLECEIQRFGCQIFESLVPEIPGILAREGETSESIC